MQSAWNKICDIIARKVPHRKGYFLHETAADFILFRAEDELGELMDAPNDIDELADTLACLLHFAIHQGWSLELVEKRILHNLSVRFIEPAEPANSTSPLPSA